MVLHNNPAVWNGLFDPHEPWQALPAPCSTSAKTEDATLTFQISKVTMLIKYVILKASYNVKTANFLPTSGKWVKNFVICC